jgi:hypothetical protein
VYLSSHDSNAKSARESSDSNGSSSSNSDKQTGKGIVKQNLISFESLSTYLDSNFIQDAHAFFVVSQLQKWQLLLLQSVNPISRVSLLTF